MRADSIEVKGFRNLAAATAPLAEGITVVHGENGAGKTNLAEALYFALTGRSFRTRVDRDLIAWREDVARSEVTVSSKAGERTVATAVERSGTKRLSIDGVAREGSAALSDRPAVAVFSPDRLDLVKGEPRARRAHLDQFAVAWRPARGDIRSRYSGCLAQRNALLMRIRAGASGAAGLDAWDRELASAGTALTGLRRESVGALQEGFASAAAELGLPGDCALRYAPSFEGSAEELAEELARRRDSDVQRGHTGVGPHRDELHLESDGRSLRRFGSQGQQRLGVLALLLAERSALTVSSAPLLILDDVMSELDSGRRGRLMDRLEDSGQALVTTADPDHVPEAGAHLRIELDAGSLTTLAAA